MTATTKTEVIKDFKSKTITIKREFDAPVELVWRAYTDSSILDQWWGPAPWRAETKSQNFIPGGYWLYAMVSPEGQKHWGRMNYIAIEPTKWFTLEDAFCDENGKMISGLPVSHGKVNFTANNKKTLVEFHMTYASEEDLQKIVEMGFEQGITACIEQLVQLISHNKI